jgi:hypothetical protein
MMPSRTELPFDIASIHQDATQPVVTTFTNPELKELMKKTTKSSHFPPVYLGGELNLLLCPVIRSTSGKNFYGKEIRIVDLTNEKLIPWSIEFFAFFKLENNDILILDKEGVAIYRLKKISDQIKFYKAKIPLPQELMQKFISSDQWSSTQPFSIKLSPDKKYLGILYSNRDFYRVDLTTCAVHQFKIGQGDNEEDSSGFLCYSADNILLYPRLIASDRKWQEATLDCKQQTATLKPKDLPPTFLKQTFGIWHWNYDVHFFNGFFIRQRVSGTTYSFDFSIDAHNPKMMDLDVGFYPQTFPQANMLCYKPSPDANTLRVLSGGQQYFQKWDIPFLNSENMVPCGEMAVLAWQDDTMAVCAFPTPIQGQVKTFIGDQFPVFMPQPVKDIIISCLDVVPPDVCGFLKSASTVVKSCTLFQPVSITFQPDLKQMNTFDDVKNVLAQFSDFEYKDNLGLVKENIILYHLQAKVETFLL